MFNIESFSDDIYKGGKRRSIGIVVCVDDVSFREIEECLKEKFEISFHPKFIDGNNDEVLLIKKKK